MRACLFCGAKSWAEAPGSVTMKCNACGTVGARQFIEAPEVTLHELLRDVFAGLEAGFGGQKPAGGYAPNSFEDLQRKIIDELTAKIPVPATRTERLATALIRAGVMKKNESNTKKTCEFWVRTARLIEKELDRE